MKKLTPYALAFLTILCLASPTKVRASHGAGGELIYEWISDSTYRWFFKFYRDCSGAGEPAQQTLCAFNPCTNQTYQWPMTKYTGLIPPGVPNGSPVSAGCAGPQYATTCDNPPGQYPGYREWWYATAPQKLIGKCDSWRFSTWVGVRNPSLNLNGQPNFYVETYFNNTLGDTNSSPYFSIKPIPYCCLNQPYTYNNGAIDPDGDSLSTDIINPLTGAGCNVLPQNVGLAAWTPAITFPSNPMQTNNTFTIAATTGQMNFIPTWPGAWTLTVRTREWRNGQLVGSVMRDVQVQVLSGCSIIPTTVGPLTNIQGAVQLPNGTVSGCVDQPINFTYTMTSTDPNAILVASDNSNVGTPGATTSYTNQKTATVTGTFSWTPTMSQAGNYSLIITLRDSTCYPPGIVYTNTVTIPFFINPATEAFKDTSVCPGDPVQLSVINGGNFQWSIIDGPAGSLSATTGPSTIASPYATTKYEVFSQQTAHCKHSRDTVVVTTLPPPPFVSPADITTCLGVPKVIDMGINPPAGVTYTMQWNPTQYLSSPNSTKPTVTPLGDVTYYIKIQSSDNQCAGFDTVVVDVLDGFSINNADTAVCDGESVQVNVTGDARYTYQWSTDDKSGGTSISDITITNPVITASPVGKWTYTLRARYDGCPDSTSNFQIEVQPIPEVTAPEDATICFGDTMHLTGKVTPAYAYTYNWSPGQSLNDPAKINPVYTSKETTTLTFTATTSAGCKDADDVTLTGIPSKFIVVRDTAICPGDTAQLHLTGTAIGSLGWMPTADNSMSNLQSADPYVYPDVTSTYTAFAVDTNGCLDTTIAKVVVNPRAVVDLPESVTVYPGESYQMRPGGNAIAYNWFPKDGLSDAEVSNPIAQPKVNTRYIVTARTENGCMVTDSIEVLVAPDSYIDVPNAFTPGHNAVLKAVRMGDATLKSFVIYNRWGNKMFETSDINTGWDGSYNGKTQPMGVYVYTIEAVTPAGRKFTKQGNITLIR